MQGHPRLTITNSSFKLNSARGTNAAGGVIWQSGGATSAQLTNFASNMVEGSVSTGGALHVQDGGVLNLTSVDLLSNVAAGQFARGGGVRTQHCPLPCISASIRTAPAEPAGPAVCFDENRGANDSNTAVQREARLQYPDSRLIETYCLQDYATWVCKAWRGTTSVSQQTCTWQKHASFAW
jgi:hypothetical protein